MRRGLGLSCTMSVAASVCLMLLAVVRLATTGQTSPYPEPDCRFWPEPKQSRADLILDRKKDREGSVFYFWSEKKQECSPCKVCPERTLSDCSYVKDTVCVSQSEWLHRGLQPTSSGLDLLESRLRSSGQANKDEGVVRLRSGTDREDHKVGY